MKKEKLKNIISETINNGEFKKEIRRVSLFGSYAMGVNNEQSDVDLLIDFYPEATVGLFKLSRIKRAFERSTGKQIDLLTPEAISKYFREDIVKNSEKIYEG